MKYLKVFGTENLQNVFRSSQNYIEPHVSCLINGGNLKYNRFRSNGYEYVDLGLPSGTLGATCNVGTSAPEELGDYYAWGEITPKQEYTWNNYKFGTENNITKYNQTDNIYNLQLADDVAYQTMGGGGHIPTYEQGQELFGLTNDEGVTINNIYCTKFISPSDSSKFIIIPHGGSKANSTVNGPYEMYYGTNYGPDKTNSWLDDTRAGSTFFDGDAGFIVTPSYCYKYQGMPVRGVLTPEADNYLQKFGLEVRNASQLPDKILILNGQTNCGDFNSFDTSSAPNYVIRGASYDSFCREIPNSSDVICTDASNFAEDTITQNVHHFYFLGKITETQPMLFDYKDKTYYADGSGQENTSDCGVMKYGNDYYLMIQYGD